VTAPTQVLGAGDAVTALAELANRPDGLAELTPLVRDLAEQLVGATGAMISVWDDERRVLKALSGAFGLTGPQVSTLVNDGTDLEHNSTARVFATGRPYLTNQTAGDPGVLQHYTQALGLHRMLSVPLRLGQRRIGVLHLANKPEDFTAEDLALVESLSFWVASAVELARSISRLQVQHRLDTVLEHTAVTIASGESLEASLLPAFEGLAAVMCGTVVAYVPTGAAPLVWRADGCNQGLEERFLADARRGNSGSLWAFTSGPDDPGWAAFHTPVMLYGERIASLSVLRERGVPMAPDEVDALARLANLAALARMTVLEQRQRAELTLLQERHRIAEGLHDRVAQILFAAQVGLDSVLESGSLGTAGHADRIREVRTLLTKGDTAIRDVIHQLSPDPDLGIGQRLRALMTDIEDEFATPIALTIDRAAEEVLTDCSHEVADGLLKVAREATVNAAKHARPCTIDVRLGIGGGGELEIAVLDDGPGLSAGAGSAASYGIASMHRAMAQIDGTLAMGPGPGGRGTAVRAGVTVH
jgi:signal transduction histidine kinase